MTLHLKLHGSLGDHVMCTGIPEAYYDDYGEFTYVETAHPVLFKNNPYTANSFSDITKEYSLAFNQYPKDYMIYYPVRIYYDITGRIADRLEVHPKLYKPTSQLAERTIIVNDQAGWPSRVGYKYFNELVLLLKGYGNTIWYIRNQGSLNCIGQQSPEIITHYTHKAFNIPIEEVIDRLSECDLYIGYDSGLSQLAGALGIPYAMLSGSVPPINTAHNSCIYALDPICMRCCKDTCEFKCLEHSDNHNDKILDAIKEKVRKGVVHD